MPKRKAPKTARPRAGNAGKPQSGDKMRAAPRAPTSADLDRRDQLKVGPRRPAGPPLGGDIPEAVPVRSLANRDLQRPTNPKLR